MLTSTCAHAHLFSTLLQHLSTHGINALLCQPQGLMRTMALSSLSWLRMNPVPLFLRHTFTCISQLKQQTKPDKHKTGRAWGRPWTPPNMPLLWRVVWFNKIVLVPVIWADERHQWNSQLLQSFCSELVSPFQSLLIQAMARKSVVLLEGAT